MGDALFSLNLWSRLWTEFNSPGLIYFGSSLTRLSPRHLFLVGGFKSKDAKIFDVEKNEWKKELEIPDEIVAGRRLLEHQAVEMKTEKGIVVVCIGGQTFDELSQNMIVFDVSF